MERGRENHIRIYYCIETVNCKLKINYSLFKNFVIRKVRNSVKLEKI